MKFGTDGVRGVAGEELTVEIATAVGRAAGRLLGGGRWLVGVDGRISGTMLAAGVAAGLAAEGQDVVNLGLIPTPGVAVLGAIDAIPGIMVSASHNPFYDNGLKVFSAGGKKLSDSVQDQLQSLLDSLLAGDAVESRREVGVVSPRHDAVDAYKSALFDAVGGHRLDGLKVVLDCANGATSEVAPAVFLALGAQVEVIHNSPDGHNINRDCGSTHPQSLQAKVVESGADVGFAFDGDGDRVQAVDQQGNLVDGDQIIALLALDLKNKGRLRGDAVVVTVMSNLGFKLAMQDAGIEVRQTPVGDRYVLEELERGGFELGGEQSGHIIMTDRSPTGDGILAALALTEIIAESTLPFSDLAGAVMQRFPQVLVNVTGVDRSALNDRETAAGSSLWGLVEKFERDLGDSGRVLLRASGTEPMIRVMVEAADDAQAREVAGVIAAAVKQHLSI